MHGFDRAYLGTPPWDIGRPQPEYVHLVEAGEIVGDVLDVGCGTGENVLYFVRQGHRAWGIDLSPNAVAAARRKANERGLSATFEVRNALELDRLGRRFDTGIDCGLFHTLSDEDRATYVESVRAALNPEGRHFVLCFSEHEPDWGGPRRVSADELRRSFADQFELRWLRPARFATREEAIEGRAWLAAFRAR